MEIKKDSLKDDSSSAMPHGKEVRKRKHLMIEYDCYQCGKSSYHLKACGRCKVARYCHESCQREHWKEHQKDCSSEKAEHLGFKGGRCVETESFEEDEEDGEGGDIQVMDRDDCPKNGHNQHKGFIPVTDFNIDHLPEPLRMEEVVEYVKAEADMTVRVLVKYTSKERPDTDKHAAERGKRSSRFASGLFVVDNPQSFKTKPCPIEKCHRVKDLGKDHDIFEGDLKIFTNKHVLFNDEEMKNTVVDFFFDSTDTSSRVREYATVLFYTKPTSDKTFFKVTVHNKEMFDRLHRLHMKRAEKFFSIPHHIVENWIPHAIVISHPHGWPKRISCGKIIKIEDENLTDETKENAKIAGGLQEKWFTSFTEEDYQQYMKCLQQKSLPVYKIWYNACTCQGSSGGQVLMGGRKVSGVWGPYMSNHVGFDVEAGLNYFKIVQFYSEEDQI